MARCDHADLMSQPTKALCYPECCSLDELETALQMIKSGHWNGINKEQDRFELETVIAKRRQASKTSRRTLNKPRFRVPCGRAPWPTH